MALGHERFNRSIESSPVASTTAGVTRVYRREDGEKIVDRHSDFAPVVKNPFHG